ncbi:MAG: primosomal protein N' [Patescibacteria group bacterium]
MFAEVLINHPYARKQERLTYEIPESENIEVGTGVAVPFQKGNRPGVVLKIRKERPDFEVKSIVKALSEERWLQPWQLELAEWISETYFCPLFDVLKLMIPKGVWRLKEIKPRKKAEVENEKKSAILHKLNEAQERVVDDFAKETRPALLFGITGSGKTEVYKKIIQQKINEGKQALLLVPEISLTPQLFSQFENLGFRVEVIHSQISDSEKAKIWQAVRKGEVNLVIGSRSALFCPFKKLGALIMDEEHEWTYKQEQNPRYHARDVAYKMAELTAAQFLMGSATPSLESMCAARENKIALYELPERIDATPLPKVQVVDMREELKGGNFSMLSDPLEQKISSRLAKGEQVILFLNRRGSASATVCRDCGYAMECPNCDAKLTHHSGRYDQPSLVCHHCGRIEKVPSNCPECQGVRIRHFGGGTEKLEVEIKNRFPLARVSRADKDTMSKKDSFKDLHRDLLADQIDILIGTQMIGKGFDLPKVTLVGVILADIGLHIPDFRASERCFQLITQVAGRAGRRKEQGEVVLQTYSPEHVVIQKSKDHDYLGFYEQEICSRREFNAPPFHKLIKLTYSHADANFCKKTALALHQKLEMENYEITVAPALMTRRLKKNHWNILIQGPNPELLIKKCSQEDLKGWRIDVNPVHTV